MLKRTIRQFTHLTSSRLIGVDAGSAAIKAVELSQEHGRMTLERCAIADAKKESVAEVVKPLVSAYHVAAVRVAVGLASPELIVRTVSFPAMPKKELQSAIHLEAEQAILNGHGVHEMAIDWHPLVAEAGEGARGLLAVVPKTLVTTRLQAFAAARLRPAIVDVEGLALWNAYWSLLGQHEAESQTVLLANIGARTTNLVIVKGRDQLLLMRDLRVGLEAIASGRGVEWSEEVRDSLAYARAKNGLRSLEAAYITGGGEERMFSPLAASTIPALVTFWNPLDQLKRGPDCPPIERRAGPLLPIAIGLALRHG